MPCATDKERCATSSSSISVVVPDGSRREVDVGATALDLAAEIGSRLAREAVAADVNGVLVDLTTALRDGDVVRVVTGDSDEGRSVIRHSTAHVMAQAVLRLFPGAEFAIGPAIADGFYYDFRLPNDGHFSQEDLPVIEAEMRKIIAEAQPFRREVHPIKEALGIFSAQPFKREIIEQVAEGHGELDPQLAAETEADSPTVSTYRNTDDFVDLCRGPHVVRTDRLGHFKLTRVAGSYWRGDEHLPQLQRIYGTAWESDRALSEYAHRLEEAERRDHRKLGQELDLFSFPEEIGSGLAVFHPKGGLVRRVMEDYSRLRHEQAGYEFVSTPHITKAELFEISGHLDWFGENIFPPMELDGGQRYYLKPMNCPMHILIYRSRQRSYRELPLRLFEFGTVYRYELSGVVHGLTRVRGMTMDDAHIFCSAQQMSSELDSILTFVLDLLRDFGLSDFYLELSTRPEGKSVGSD
ncbi:MAG TPA: threonine--tRNA ligase, partial [Acidimicrobiales bacterium]|nr:threonine--tRNA ligase [Acidimicrobiales bacterium]